MSQDPGPEQSPPQNSQLKEQLIRLKLHDHVCAIYSEPEEQFPAIAEFIKVGLARNEQCIYIADENSEDVVFRHLRAAGIDVDSRVGQGALILLGKEQAYLKPGYFSADAMMEFWEQWIKRALQDGFTGLRVTGEATWALGADVDVRDLIQYEAKINNVIPHMPVVAACLYNARRFGKPVIRSIIHTHPIVIYGNMVARNRYYIPPEEFLPDCDGNLSVDRLLHSIVEQQKTHTDLARSEALYRAVVNGSDDAIITKRLDGTITSWNPGAERLYGYPSQEITGKSISLLVPANHQDEIPRLLERIGKGERVPHHETVRCRKDGTRIHVSLCISPLLDEEGTIVGASTIARDITAMKQASQYTRSLIETSLDPLVTINVDGKITDVNEATIATTGVSREELVGTDFCDYFTEPEKARRGYQLVFSEGLVRDYPLTIRHRDGRLTEVLYNAAVYRDNDGKVLGVFAAARDVTRLNQINQRLRLVVDTVPCGIILVNADGKIALANPGAEALFGYDKGALIGESVDELVPEQVRDRHPFLRESYMSSMVARPLGAGRDLQGRRRDGSEFPVEVGLAPIETEAGTNVLATIVDITERKHAEEAARLALIMEQRDQFVTMLAHDLKSPLIGCKQMMDFFLDGTLGPLTDEQRQELRLIRDSSQSLLQLVQNLVDVYRIENGAYAPRLEIIDIGELVRECCQEIAPIAASRNIHIDKQVTVGLEAVETDAIALHRVLQNLIDNAQKFSAPGSSIIVSVAQVDGQVVIEVRDSGPGIPEAEQANLFQRFKQGKPGRRFTTGSGLGLFLCKHLLTAIGGEITYRSGEGGGAVFTVTLNVRTPEFVSRDHPQVEEQIDILLVEDSPITLAGLSMLCERAAGLSVAGEATNGESACRLAEQLKPAVVLMDIKLPDISGIEACRRIKDNLPDVRILMLTALDDTDTILDAVKAGADGYCLKDVSGQDLIKAVRAVAKGYVWFHPQVGRIFARST